jgi:hypothetical protein
MSSCNVEVEASCCAKASKSMEVEKDLSHLEIEVMDGCLKLLTKIWSDCRSRVRLRFSRRFEISA